MRFHSEVESSDTKVIYFQPMLKTDGNSDGGAEGFRAVAKMARISHPPYLHILLQHSALAAE